MKEQKRVPKLRFKEFTNDWKKSNIEDLFEFKNGLNKEKEFFGKGTPIINFMDVYKLNSIHTWDINGLVELNESEIKRFSAEKGDVFFTRTSETIDDIGMSATLVDSIENCVFSGFVLRARPKNETFIPAFTSYLFGISSIRKEITTKSSMTTRALTSGTLLNKVNFSFPDNKNEQQKIASFLSSVDKKIAQLQQKKALLEDYKKGVMRRIFSQELRFTKEDGSAYPDWEEKRLNKFIQIKSGISPSNFELEEQGATPFIKVEELNNCVKYQIDSRFYSNKTEGVIEPNAIIFPKRGAAIWNNKVRIANVPIFMDSNMMALVPDNSHLKHEFLYYLIVYIQLFKIADTSSIPQINNKHIEYIKFMKPQLEEQTQIAQFLSAIDTKIAIVQTQIENTQTFKKGLLQQMFV